jgi:hypothetical protein
MDDIKRALILDLVEWVAVQPRPYAEVMAAWRTSCPRLTIWEDAVEQGFVVRAHRDGIGAVVQATPRGLALLGGQGRLPRQTAAA